MARRQEKLTLIRLCVILGLLVWIPTISRVLVGIDKPQSASSTPAETPPPLEVHPVSNRSDAEPIVLASAPDQLRLSATYLSGDRRSAVVNGKLLVAGDIIRTESESFRVEQIESGRVELVAGRQHFELMIEDDEWGRWVPFTMDETP